MTLKEHLSTIESYLVENGQEKTTALLYKLFLLCEKIRDHAANGRREQDSESYDKVAAYVNNISLSGRNIDAIKAFKCDRSIDKLLVEDFLEEFYEQLNLIRACQYLWCDTDVAY
ncbi:MAG: hypothetical protein ACI3Y9_02015 [Candidatus Cryptobacteroides sp.]